MKNKRNNRKQGVNMKKPLILHIRAFLRSHLTHFREKIELPVFHKEDTESIFRQIGLWEDFRSGRLKCAFCHQVITGENLKCIFSEKGEIALVCSNSACADLSLQKRIDGEGNYDS